MICSNCGHLLDEGKLFCGNCGHLNSNNSQAQKSIHALELIKANKYDLFALGWSALIAFSLGRHFLFLPEVVFYMSPLSGGGSMVSVQGFVIPSPDNAIDVNLAFVFLIIFNIMSLAFIIKTNNESSKNKSGISGVLLILLSPFVLIAASLGKIFVLPFILICELLFYLGIVILVISKLNGSSEKFISSGFSGMAIGVVASFFISFSRRLFYLPIFWQILLNCIFLIPFAVYALKQNFVEQKPSNEESEKVRARRKLLVAGLFFAPFFINIAIGYILYAII